MAHPQKALSKRDRILDAALRTYVARGYQASSVKDIAATAGIGKGSVYLSFKSKEELNRALVDRHFAALEAQWEEIPSPTSLNDFAEMLEEMLNISEAQTEFVSVFYEIYGPTLASADFRFDVTNFFNRFSAFLTYRIAILQELGAVPASVDAAGLGRVLASALDGVILHRGLFDPRPEVFTRQRRAFIALLVDGLAMPSTLRQPETDLAKAS